MNKSELVRKVAEKAGLPHKQAEAATNAIFDTIEEALASREKVQIIGFGTFERRQRGERRARNPHTGETITVPSVYVPVFKAGNGLKAAVKA
ncbi:MAG: HU family DNA-binding protein [Alicyclobacillus sp.]|nr:HU family DNA-binding protein [Alicyclobacillus sp.]